ncbi:hypothetical protein AAU57_05760 [Nonlabens sp. YIK11]|uniref:hypothetical protein n=1 Tax=Nonlabens sp. YIK11 TaxID=1453349 RepID=UPI0006DD1FB3|nr:hypothetical protein [Nonlabens sp. YIK11]KQC32874.1 hypothetical protein AAU57_05760 [Nonlabens sp. YIK11]
MKSIDLKFKNQFLYSYLFILGMVTFSCSNDDDAAAVDPSPELVILAAKDVNGTEIVSIKSESETIPLEMLPDNNVSAMTVDNGIVYTSGYYKNNNEWNGVFWQGTAAQRLTDTGNRVYTVDIAIDKGDIYIAGREIVPGTSNLAKVWKNGVLKDLETPSFALSIPNAIAIKGGESYTCGYIRPTLGGSSRAVIWKDQMLMELPGNPNAVSADARAIVVAGEDHYVAGYESDQSSSIGKIWRNDQLLYSIRIPEASLVLESIDVYEGDVYTIGRTLSTDGSGVRTLQYFKNNVSVAVLAQSATSANAIKIKVIDGDVYCLGIYRDAQDNLVSTIWKNGVEQEFPYLDSQELIYGFDFYR